MDTIIDLSIRAYNFLLPIAWIGLAISLVVCGPLAIFRTTRPVAGLGFWVFSYLLGATTWFLGCSITLATWGWIAVVIGILLGGVGVVPIAVFASAISLHEYLLSLSIVVMAVMVFVFRWLGVILSEQ